MLVKAPSHSLSSSARFANHERSKKHIKNVELLRAEMLMDEDSFELGNSNDLEDGDADDDVDGSDVPVDGDSNVDDQSDAISEESGDDDDYEDALEEQVRAMDLADSETTKDDYSDDSSNSMDEARRFGATSAAPVGQQPPQSPKAATSPPPPSSKNKKPRRRKDKKAVVDTATVPASNNVNDGTASDATDDAPHVEERAFFLCNVCNTAFTTRNKLFAHIRDTGHALAADARDSKAKGRKAHETKATAEKINNKKKKKKK